MLISDEKTFTPKMIDPTVGSDARVEMAKLMPNHRARDNRAER
jgi:hypothetical protein